MLAELLQVGIDVGFELSNICPKFGDLIRSSLEVTEVRKIPKCRYISKPAISETTCAKTLKLRQQLGIALGKTCAKFGVCTSFGSKKNRREGQLKFLHFQMSELITKN